MLMIQLLCGVGLVALGALARKMPNTKWFRTADDSIEQRIRNSCFLGELFIIIGVLTAMISIFRLF
ncbi:hypothetical protein ACTHPF_07195 [Paenibacillus sp. SAF-054]|uniref:hypothetical protein n=1 Tax=unclassified Paenibacillus TaxID=185978 RepID=UPI003F7CE473